MASWLSCMQVLTAVQRTGSARLVTSRVIPVSQDAASSAASSLVGTASDDVSAIVQDTSSGSGIGNMTQEQSLRQWLQANSVELR